MTPPALTSMDAPLVFALAESAGLGREVAAAAGLDVAPLEERRFESGEFKLRPLVSVRDREVCIVQSLAGTGDLPVGDRLLRLLLLSLGLRDAGARRLTAFLPYLPFARKDRRTQPRDPVTLRYVAQLLEAAGIDRLLALDVHNPAAFDNAFRIPTDHLSAQPLFVNHFASRLAPDIPLAVASPDVGGVKRAQLFRERLERRLGRDVELVFLGKRRAAGVVSGGGVVGDVAGRAAIVLDDLCATGGTLIRAATALRAAGASQVHAVFTHAPQPDGLAALEGAADIDSIVLTDSTGTPATDRAAPAGRRVVIGIAPLLGAVLRRLHAHLPVTPLLEEAPARVPS